VLQWNVNVKKKKNRSILCRDYKEMDVDEFMRKIDSKLNDIENNYVNALANVAINVIVEYLDEMAPRKKVAR